MIVIDTSALIAVALSEPMADLCKDVLAREQRLLLSAPTITETMIVAHGYEIAPAMQTMLDRLRPTIVPLTPERAFAAAQAYRRYGKGWHAASLNYGDSFSYALAREYGCPLLFIGNDFAKTDVEAAI